MALVRHADYRTGESHPSAETLARESRMGRTRVFEGIDALVDAGWLTRNGRRGFSAPNSYTVNRSAGERMVAPFVQPANDIRSAGERLIVQPANANENHLTRTIKREPKKEPEMQPGVREVMQFWCACHGKGRMPALNPTLMARLEKAVEDLGVERLKASAKWSAEVGATEPIKFIRGAYTQQRSEQAPAPPRNGTNGHAKPSEQGNLLQTFSRKQAGSNPHLQTVRCRCGLVYSKLLPACRCGKPNPELVGAH